MRGLNTMQQPFIIISPDRDQIAEIKAMVAAFPELKFMGVASGIEDGIDLALRYQPAFVFLEVRQRQQLYFVSELMRYTQQLPQIVVISPDQEFAIEAMRYGCYDYFSMPYGASDLRKTLLRYQRDISVQKPNSTFAVAEPIEIQTQEGVEKKKHASDVTSSVQASSAEQTAALNVLSIVDEEADSNSGDETIAIPVIQQEKEASTTVATLRLCVKSHGDYRFIESDEIAFLKADNNSTDIHLLNGEVVTAFKTLKLFEQALPLPFVRIHNSYIVNMEAIQRIHTGNAVVYLKPDGIKIPISKSYKDQVETILNYYKMGRFLEI